MTNQPTTATYENQETRIPISLETRSRLKLWAVQNGLTYDQAINLLLDKAQQAQK